MKCCICDQDSDEYPNNPYPFKGKGCCVDCDDRFVTPARVFYIEDGEILKLLKQFAKHGARNIKMRSEVKNLVKET